jgi:hypothetical protein
LSSSVVYVASVFGRRCVAAWVSHHSIRNSSSVAFEPITSEASWPSWRARRIEASKSSASRRRSKVRLRFVLLRPLSYQRTT